MKHTESGSNVEPLFHLHTANIEIGSTVVTIRKAEGIIQEELAFDANISIGRLRDIEHGTANYTRDTVYSIAAAMGISACVFCMASDCVYMFYQSEFFVQK